MSIPAHDLANFYPLDKLRPESLEQLAAEAEITEFGNGDTLFVEGDSDEHTYYLMAGIVRAKYSDGKVKDLDASSLQGRYPLGDLRPRRFTALVESMAVTVVKFERHFLEKVIAWDALSKDAGFTQYDSAPGANRWVFRLLHNRAVHKLPTGNIERMFQRLEQVEYIKGEVVVREGDAADYFYVIKDGSASVSRMVDGNDAIVAYLVRGDTFGEDALLTQSNRNATVTMMSNGKLMRLGPKDFAEVLKPPVVDWVTAQQAAQMIREGALIIDVRLPDEFEDRSIKGAENIPLYSLRDKSSEFDRFKPIVLCCNTGERSAAAAFILSKSGFKAFALQGGLNAALKQMGSTP